ncbi:MAG: sortase B protein-sorting domain-containing protein [Lachnospiraceae bacterium]|nr:sortase B protein-sorting domain-containing protein [Lachnospiraceae bacterium]
MKKRLIALGLAGILLASSVTVFAEDRTGESGWKVTFDGNKMIDNFSTSDIDKELFSLLPGDTMELSISLENTDAFKGKADWYLSNKVIDTLEKADDGSQIASGGAYDYLLTYTDTKGKTTPIYSSEKFGGEGKFNGVGLEGATVTLDEYFFLERLGDGDTGVVKLKVALDGETLANEYQDTLAQLKMQFAAEVVQSDTAGTPSQTRGRNREIIKTGDQSQMMLYILLSLGSGLMLLLIALLRMRRENEEVLETGDSIMIENSVTGEDEMSEEMKIGRRR